MPNPDRLIRSRFEPTAVDSTNRAPHPSRAARICTILRASSGIPVSKTDASSVANYSLRHFELGWHAGYGTRPSNSQMVTPKSATVSADGLQVTLDLPELLTKKIYELNISGLAAADGSKLEHPRAFYTLNRLKK